MSGVNLPNEVARPLEVLWRERTGSEHRGRPEEYESTVGLNEGSVSRVYVNRYERNPRARSICLDHHDPVCAVCAQRMSEIYQGVPDELIHVHHIIPISMIREEYRIDPIKQMVPVCPNCHAVIHSQSPPLTIDEVRKRRREQK